MLNYNPGPAKAIVKQFLLGGESSILGKGLHEPGKQGIGQISKNYKWYIFTSKVLYPLW